MERTVEQISRRKKLADFLLVALCCLTAAGANQGAGLTEPDRGTNLDNRVDVKHVVKVLITRLTPAYSIEYGYRFPGRTRVRIQNVGLASASGHFRYLTTDESLVFRDADLGTVLADVPLHATITPAAKPPLNEIANETDFPAAYRAFRWRGREGLLLRANSVLGRYFRYRPFERDGRTFIVTTYSPLEIRGVREGVLGRVALLVSYPYDAATGVYDFHVQSLVREGRTHSDEFRLTSDPALIQAADAFVDNLTAEILQGGRP